jgi:hypothetical protein
MPPTFAPQPMDDRPGTGILILGASNVRRHRLHLVRWLSRQLPSPWHLILVAGHGRSYGRRNRVVGWRLPAIQDAAWVEPWRRLSVARRFALVCDVGNDLMYGSNADQLTAWVLESTQRIGVCDQLTLAGLPIERAEMLVPWQFELFKRCFFPGCDRKLDPLRSEAKVCDEQLAQWAKSMQWRWVQPPARWYGWDPIHLRRAVRQEAWRELMGLPEESVPTTSIDSIQGDRSFFKKIFSGTTASLNRQWKAWNSMALEQTWGEWKLGHTQPIWSSSQGDTIAYY